MMEEIKDKNETCSYCGKKMIDDSSVLAPVGFGSETKKICSDPNCKSHEPVSMIGELILEELEHEDKLILEELEHEDD